MPEEILPHADGPGPEVVVEMARHVVAARPEATLAEHLGAMMVLNSGKLNPKVVLESVRAARAARVVVGQRRRHVESRKLYVVSEVWDGWVDLFYPDNGSHYEVVTDHVVDFSDEVP